MAKRKNQADGEELDFEQSLEELETIVRRLEQGGGALEEALGDYSTAILLLKNCHRRLEAAERRVELLSGVDAQGNPVTQPMEDASSATLAEKQESRSERRSAGSAAAPAGAANKPKRPADDGNVLF
jgi:exodeoxyribonuclease VII small subunit